MKQKESKQATVASAYPDHYEIYEDGSMKAWCKRCNNPEEVPAERAEKIKKIPDWSSSFTCTPCWRKSKEPDQHDTQDRIAYAQSWNLAVATIPNEFKHEQTFPTFTEELEKRQKYFLEKLTNR